LLVSLYISNVVAMNKLHLKLTC